MFLRASARVIKRDIGNVSFVVSGKLHLGWDEVETL